MAEAATAVEQLPEVELYPYGVFYFHAPKDDALSARLRSLMKRSVEGPYDALKQALADSGAAGKRVGKDADQGKRTYPGIVGVEQSVGRAEQLVTEACEALEPLGQRAGGLVALARFILERNR